MTADRPAALLGSINEALTGQLNNEFITTTCLWFNCTGMILHHASAGHPAPVLLRGDKADDSPFTSKGIPIGIKDGIQYSEGTIGLAKGDRIVVYTDGLTDVFSPRGELFGRERLLSVLRKTRELSGRTFTDRIIGDVITWSGRKKQESLDDDLTVVVIDIK